jgi:tRNA-splicing endonuclease subunit Sen34
MHNHSRKAYIEMLRKTKQTAYKVATERNAKRSAEHAEKIAQGQGKTKNAVSVQMDDVPLDTTPSSLIHRQPADAQLFAVTPTTTKELVNAETDTVCERPDVPEGPLARHLQLNGYYMTPGLRFGARYSVYPGDPLRFHAHYMANQYGWEEEIPILDVVEGGRLATAVKKAFLIGGEEPRQCSSSSDGGIVRTYSIEWAGM